MSQILPERGTAWTVVGLFVLGAVLGTAVFVAFRVGDGSPSWQRAVAFSATVCGGGAMSGWLVARWPKRTAGMAVAGGLAAIVLRTLLPLAALGWLHSGGRPLRAVGADRFLLVFYLTLLATDIILHMIEATRNGRRRGGNVAN